MPRQPADLETQSSPDLNCSDVVVSIRMTSEQLNDHGNSCAQALAFSQVLGSDPLPAPSITPAVKHHLSAAGTAASVLSAGVCVNSCRVA